MPSNPPIPHDLPRQLNQQRPRNDPNDTGAPSSPPPLTPPPFSPSSPDISATPDTQQGTDIPSTPLSTPISTPMPTSLSPQSDPGPVVFTSVYPITTITLPSTTITSFTELLITQDTSSSPTTSSSTFSSSFTPSSSTTASSALSTNSLVESQLAPVCLGQGVDSAAAGILSVVIVPTIIGLILWILFAVLRPRFRQVYALREWFVQPDLRPKPLGSAFFAFLFPKVPLVPSVPSDVSDAGRSAANDARLFPSDEELVQRGLWVALLIALGWSVLAVGGALPLYLVNTPCNGDYAASIFTGGYSTLTDLSFLRLLRAVETGGITTDSFTDGLQRRLANPIPEALHLRVRIIILAALTIGIGILPVLWKIIKEFNRIAAYRRQWLQVKCEGKDLAWLSAKAAPGYAHWGERQLKDHLVKIGLSSTLGQTSRRNGSNNGVGYPGGARSRTALRREEEQPLNEKSEESVGEVDIQSLFSIGDTHKIAILIEERDQILENLEISEAKYINSFRITTPDPSVLDFVPPPPPDPSKPYISRPIPLAGNQRRPRSRRHLNRAFASSSLAPTSFIAPSSYYKLRGVRGVSGGRFAEANADRHQSFADSINSRVIGSRFMEVNRNSVAYGRLPLGTNVAVEQSGELGPVDRGSWIPPIPDPRLFGPNYGLTAYEDMEVDEHGIVRTIYEQEEAREWVDLSQDEGQYASDFNGIPPDQAGPSSFLRRPRPPKTDSTPPSTTRRETFPRRETTQNVDPDAVPPPHLRLQPTQPFVRPLDGLDFEDLGEVYAEITHWRSRLKIINVEIADAQNQCYNDIAQGLSINGWLMVGRGLRFIPGAQIIEGRAKEDIRWDVLQNERSGLDTAVMWAVVIATMVILGAALTATVGLYLAPAPDFAHYLQFLQPLSNGETVASGLATILAPAVAATIFLALGVRAIHWVAAIHGSVSVSGNQLLIFRITFFLLTGIGAIWLVAIGAVLFSMQSFNTGVNPTLALSNGAVYMSILALALIINVAVTLPGCLLLQPVRLWRVLRGEKAAVTPRQRFRAVYPRMYDPTYAIGACVLALVFASSFALIFPLIAPAVVVLLFLTLIAHRYLVGYVYARTHSQTGGLLYLWILRRFGTLLCLQPLLLGLICLSLHFWEEGGVLIGTAIFVILFVEIYTSWKMRLPGHKSLSPITLNSLETFSTGADTYQSEIDSVNDSTPAGTRTRGSMASVLEMMSVTLAVMPSSSHQRGAVPLPTETLDDLTATERAARTHPDAPPRLPPLPFTDHAEDMAGILYAPELIAPPPIIWLPKGSGNLAQSEAVDLQKYHDLQVTVDVRSKEDVLHLQRTSSSSRRPSR